MRCQQHQASGDDQPFQSVPLSGGRGEQPSGRRSAQGLDELVSSHVIPPSAFSLRGGVVTRGVPLFENWPEKATHAPDWAAMQNRTIERGWVALRTQYQARSLIFHSRTVSEALLRHHSPRRRHRAGGRHWRDRERQPGVPARRPVGLIEFALSLQIQIALHVANWKQKSDLRTYVDDA